MRAWNLPSVAVPLNGAPVREQVPVVGLAAAPRRDHQTVEEGLGRVFGGDAGLGVCELGSPRDVVAGTYGVRDRRGGGEGAACEEHESSLHCAGWSGVTGLEGMRVRVQRRSLTSSCRADIRRYIYTHRHGTCLRSSPKELDDRRHFGFDHPKMVTLPRPTAHPRVRPAGFEAPPLGPTARGRGRVTGPGLFWKADSSLCFGTIGLSAKEGRERRVIGICGCSAGWDVVICGIPIGGLRCITWVPQPGAASVKIRGSKPEYEQGSRMAWATSRRRFGGHQIVPAARSQYRAVLHLGHLQRRCSLVELCQRSLHVGYRAVRASV